MLVNALCGKGHLWATLDEVVEARQPPNLGFISFTFLFFSCLFFSLLGGGLPGLTVHQLNLFHYLCFFFLLGMKNREVCFVGFFFFRCILVLLFLLFFRALSGTSRHVGLK